MNRFVRNTIAYIFAAFIIKGLAFITTPIFTRLMTTTDYGITMNFITWGQILAIFICMQVSSSVVSANENLAKGRINSYVYSLICFSLISAVSFALLIIPLLTSIKRVVKMDGIYVIGVCIFALGTALSDLFSSYCIATNKVTQKVLFAILSSVLFISSGILMVLFVVNKADGRISAYILSHIVIIIFVIAFFFRQSKEYDRRFKEDLHFALVFSIPLIPHVFANMVNGQIDRVFLINICGESAVGVYSVSYSVGALALTFAGAATDAWTPWYYRQSKEKKVNDITKYYKLYSTTIAMCFLGVILLSNEIMGLMAPKEYSGGVESIPYIAIGIFFLFMYRFPLCYEQLLGNTKYVAPATVLAAFINVFFNAVLIPKFGINGAAISTSISYFMLWIFHEIVSRKVVKGYNIRLINSLSAVFFVFFAFFISIIVKPSNLFRYIIIIFSCILYVAYFIITVRRKTNEIL